MVLYDAESHGIRVQYQFAGVSRDGLVAIIDEQARYRNLNHLPSFGSWRVAKKRVTQKKTIASVGRFAIVGCQSGGY